MIAALGVGHGMRDMCVQRAWRSLPQAAPLEALSLADRALGAARTSMLTP